jgi:hypothetical protein
VTRDEGSESMYARAHPRRHERAAPRKPAQPSIGAVCAAGKRAARMNSLVLPAPTTGICTCAMARRSGRGAIYGGALCARHRHAKSCAAGDDTALALAYRQRILDALPKAA